MYQLCYFLVSCGRTGQILRLPSSFWEIEMIKKVQDGTRNRSKRNIAITATALVMVLMILYLPVAFMRTLRRWSNRYSLPAAILLPQHRYLRTIQDPSSTQEASPYHRTERQHQR